MTETDRSESSARYELKWAGGRLEGRSFLNDAPHAANTWVRVKPEDLPAVYETAIRRFEADVVDCRREAARIAQERDRLKFMATNRLTLEHGWIADESRNDLRLAFAIDRKKKATEKLVLLKK